MIKARNEMRIYEALGVVYFRKLVFQLEKIIHRKDHGYNRNYHIKVNSISGIREFSKYLFYNGSIHVKNILLAIIYGFIRYIIQYPFFWLDVIILILSIKDLYCIMLQRWNYLRIQIRIEVLEKRKVEKINRNSERIFRRIKESGYSKELAVTDWHYVKEVNHKAARSDTIVLHDVDYDQIYRIINIALRE